MLSAAEPTHARAQTFGESARRVTYRRLFEANQWSEEEKHYHSHQFQRAYSTAVRENASRQPLRIDQRARTRIRTEVYHGQLKCRRQVYIADRPIIIAYLKRLMTFECDLLYIWQSETAN